MKEFITGVEKSVVNPEIGSNENHSDPEAIKKLLEDVQRSGEEGLDTLQPQTLEQEKTKGILSRIGDKIKSFTAGKEKTPQDQLQEDIHSLTHFTSANAGMGGLGNFSSGGFKSLSSISERYAIQPEIIESITLLQKQVEDLNNGPQKVEAMKKLRDQKIAVMQYMRNTIEGK